MKKLVDLKKESEELLSVVGSLSESFYERLEATAKLFDETFREGHKILVCGNGGSAAEVQHISDEMLGRYKNNRPAYPVIALTADSMAITCIGNDYGFEEIFSRQVEALGQKGDVLIGLSTSGNSKNVLKAVETAKARGMKIVALTAPKGKLRELADISIESPSMTTARIQEVHLHAIHLLCEFFEAE